MPSEIDTQFPSGSRDSARLRCIPWGTERERERRVHAAGENDTALAGSRIRPQRSSGGVCSRGGEGAYRLTEAAAVPLFLRPARIAPVRGDLRAAGILSDARGAPD